MAKTLAKANIGIAKVECSGSFDCAIHGETVNRFAQDDDRLICGLRFAVCGLRFAACGLLLATCSLAAC